MRILVVWEPMLPMDWEPPSTGALARLHQPGVVQFWDHEHLVAHEISSELAAYPSGPQPRCCTSHGNLWDFAGLYPKGAVWQATPPKVIFADGPVAHVQPGLGSALSALLNQKQ